MSDSVCIECPHHREDSRGEIYCSAKHRHATKGIWLEPMGVWMTRFLMEECPLAREIIEEIIIMRIKGDW